jgi:hypothetical protein
VLEFAERYMGTGDHVVDSRVVAVRIGELDGKETLEVEVTDLGADVPDTFQGIAVVVRKFPPEAETTPDVDVSPEIRKRLESIDPDGAQWGNDRGLLHKILDSDSETGDVSE